MFSKKQRLNTEEFQKVFSIGKIIKSEGFLIKYLKNNNSPRFAVAVSKKNSKSAFGRNRIKRIIFNFLKKDSKDFPFVDFIILPEKNFVEANKGARLNMLQKLSNVLKNKS